MPCLHRRRPFVLLGGLAAAGSFLAGLAPRPVLRTYREVGEPHGSRQHVRVRPGGSTRRGCGVSPSRSRLARRMLAIAEGYARAGVSRRTDRPQVARFCRLFGLGYKTDGSPTPFCASGASYSGC